MPIVAKQNTRVINIENWIRFLSKDLLVRVKFHSNGKNDSLSLKYGKGTYSRPLIKKTSEKRLNASNRGG